MAGASRPVLATTGAGWSRRLAHAAALLVLALLAAVLLRAGHAVLAEGEALALDMAERHLRNLVWLEGQRVLAREGVAGLAARVGQDPRAWTEPWPAELGQDRSNRAAAPAMDTRWQFDAARGELVYTPAWLPEPERRWRVVLSLAADERLTPAQAQGLRLERVSPSRSGAMGPAPP
ncbi:MAG: hypothetical protein KatS3mg128_0332 [Silanimonas sp.]|nr:MAG: hypothetical protein KatS3mg128_0332 [Silanimonas sp.]